jgi:hypothetical protein
MEISDCGLAVKAEYPAVPRAHATNEQVGEHSSPITCLDSRNAKEAHEREEHEVHSDRFPFVRARLAPSPAATSFRANSRTTIRRF